MDVKERKVKLANGGCAPAEAQCRATARLPHHSAVSGCMRGCILREIAVNLTRGPSRPGLRSPAPR